MATRAWRCGLLRGSASLLGVGLMVLSCAPAGGPLDLLLTGGHVVDGSGGPPAIANVGISAGRVSYLGLGTPVARETLSVRGKTIVPGFIYAIGTIPGSQISDWSRAALRVGVTTLVLGADGLMTVPDIQRLVSPGALENSYTNIAALVGAASLVPTESADAAELGQNATAAISAGALGIAVPNGYPSRQLLAAIYRWADRSASPVLLDARAPVARRFAPTLVWEPDLLPGGKGDELLRLLPRSFDLYVRRLGLASSEAVTMLLTAQPAAEFNLRDRGLVTQGYIADMLIVDIREVGEFDEGEVGLAPPWLHHALLAGRFVVRNGVLCEPSGAFLNSLGAEPRETRAASCISP